MPVALERLWETRNRVGVLALAGCLITLIALVDWWTKPYVSLGFLYLFPIMLAAGCLPRWAVALLGGLCAVFAELFSSLEPSPVRLAFESLALAGCGLFVGELVRNRRLSAVAEAKLKVLVETSPAAIVTVDERGFVELANLAARELMAPLSGRLVSEPIAAYLPDLHHALRRIHNEKEHTPQLRASMQCLARRGNGETFLADVWFSTYREDSEPKLAAIVADVTEESESAAAPGDVTESPPAVPLSAREADALRLLVQGLANKEIAARMCISESAVKNTLQQLFAKSGVRTRSQLVRVALERHRNLF